MTNIDLSKKWHFKTKKCRKVHQDHQLSNNEGPYCQFSITMICSLFSSSYHRSVNFVMDKNWNTGAFWGTTELSSKWILSPLLHLFSSLTSLCFLLIGLQEICWPPFSSFWKYPTALVTISHSPHLPGHLEDYISHHPAVDKIMWLLLANGLGVEVSPVTLGRKHLRASVWLPIFFLPLEWSICWSGCATDENSYTREGGFPRKLPDSQRGLCRNKEQTCVKPLKFRYYLLQQCNLVCSNQHQPLRPIWPKQTCICVC